jgi:hypothetical protein
MAQDKAFVSAIARRTGSSPSPQDVLGAYRALGEIEELIADGMQHSRS